MVYSFFNQTNVALASLNYAFQLKNLKKQKWQYIFVMQNYIYYYVMLCYVICYVMCNVQ